MKPRKGSGDGGSLDSLLDTMTNVVGILIIVLVMTQLNLSRTMSEFRDRQKERNVTAEQVEAVTAELASARATLKQLQTGALDEEDPMARRLAVLRDRVRALERERDAIEVADLAALRTRRDTLRKEREALDERIAAMRLRIQEAEEMLAKIPVPQPLPALRVRLPAPRPAPEGAKEVPILCWRNRVIPLDDLARYHQLTQSRIYQGRRDLLRKGVTQPEEPEKLIYDGPAVDKSFGARPAVMDGLRFTTHSSPVRNRLYLRLTPQDGAGEGIEEMQARRSRFLRALSKVLKNGDYVRFYVDAESFEIYELARRACENYDLPTGWVPWGSGNFTRTLPKILVHREREPPPAKPSTAKPNPNVLD